MNRLVCITLLTIGLSMTVLAQNEPGLHKSSLGATAEISIPSGDFGNIAGTGYGGLVRYQYGCDELAAVIVSGGYLVWGEKEITSGAKLQAETLEFMVGGKYYFTPGFFGSMEGGLYGLSYTRTGDVTGYEGTTWRFILPFGLGYQMNGIEIGARYVYVMDFSNFSFTLGYNWML